MLISHEVHLLQKILSKILSMLTKLHKQTKKMRKVLHVYVSGYEAYSTNLWGTLTC